MPLVARELSVRSAFVPRPGYAFIDADVEALEMVTLAQVEIWLLRDHRKAKQINSGTDLHCVTGSVIAGMNYRDFYRAAKGEDPETHERFTKDKLASQQRNLSKVANFGKPGGMADRTLVGFARSSYGLKLGASEANPRPSLAQSQAEAIRLGNFWREANPNDQDYLDRMRGCRQQDGTYTVIIGHPSIGSVVRRGRASYCAACNSPFQGLGALVSGEVTFEIQRRSYSVPTSALYGCRLVVHAYDSWTAECPIERVTEAAAELSHVIETYGARKVPDVQLRAPASASTTWDKNAERVVRDGQLLIWGTDECNDYLQQQKKAA
jgi:DNA polymerase I-like protein with 3'-5' exonuclease and polymerase domains